MSEIEKDLEARNATRPQVAHGVSDKTLAVVSVPEDGSCGTGPYVFIHGKLLARAEAKFEWENGKRPRLIIDFMPEDVELMSWAALVARRDAAAKAYREEQDRLIADTEAGIRAAQEAFGAPSEEVDRIPVGDECGCGACGIDHD